jgi:dihydropteroate synthase
MRGQGDVSQLRRVFPFRAHAGAAASVVDLDGPTQVMSILNTTPDSFSDGGDHTSLDTALAAVRSHIEQGADMIDIGGASTRPGASEPSEAEEVDRVVPIVRAIRSAGLSVALSVDTYTAVVAEQAVEAGANLINDVTAGVRSGDALLRVAASLRCPLCLMHTRGDPTSMTKLTTYDAGLGGVVAVAALELRDRVDAALRAGVPRWAILVDPGIGFAKDLDGNLALLRDLPRFAGPDSPLAGYPVLVGASRKRFLGTLTGREVAKDRAHATGATVVASVAAGAIIVRVHDVAEMRDVVAVADAIYRPHLRARREEK